MSNYIFSGIQQIGIGVHDMEEAWKWYRKNLGFDVPIFEEEAVADLMLPYTGGKPRKRRAVLALNMNGGGGIEVWQYKDRSPVEPDSELRLGDLGIYCAKIRTRNINSSFKYHKSQDLNISEEIAINPEQKKHYFLKDPYGNRFQIIEGDEFFGKTSFHSAGIAGAIIGCSNIDQSLDFYSDILGYNKVVYDIKGENSDMNSISPTSTNGRRLLLRREEQVEGAFSKLLGSSEIELFESSEFEGRKIFRNRYWGDLGFIHLCFDISGMETMKSHCKDYGIEFTVDSSEGFDMGEAAGHFSYIEDPDGTLIEFVETHKIPIIKQIGWYLNLKSRNPRKPLPSWMIKLLSLNRKRS